MFVLDVSFNAISTGQSVLYIALIEENKLFEVLLLFLMLCRIFIIVLSNIIGGVGSVTW